jgi:hypothetical protein
VTRLRLIDLLIPATAWGRDSGGYLEEL